MLHRFPHLSDFTGLGVDAPRPPADTVAAAVALVVAGDPRDLRLCVIERARRTGDPWSGHMALPGGRFSAHDDHLRRTAERETLEEVAIELAAAQFLGHVMDHTVTRAGVRAMALSAFAYHVPDATPLAPSAEVESAFWVSLRDLWHPGHQVQIEVHAAHERHRQAATRVGPRHIWGLTRRVLAELGLRTGSPLPGPPADANVDLVYAVDPGARRDFDAWTHRASPKRDPSDR